jgi:deoxycytidylate deaminase
VSSLLDIGYFRLARNISKQSLCRVQVGAVIAHKRPISVACNKLTTHPLYANPNTSHRLSIHAEINAIIHAEMDLNGATIYVYRETKRGRYGLARPCDLCMSVIKEAGIKKIIFTTDVYPFYETEKL